MKKRKEHTLKKALVYLMLIVYTFGLIKPIMPIIDDVLAHTFFKNEHIATVHYENGKQHIHLELIKEASSISRSSASSTHRAPIQASALKSGGRRRRSR